MYSLNREKGGFVTTISASEFYTLLSDIEAELQHYKKRFRGKIIYCNCDNPEFSNFWKYFKIHFEEFGIKKLWLLELIQICRLFMRGKTSL